MAEWIKLAVKNGQVEFGNGEILPVGQDFPMGMGKLVLAKDGKGLVVTRFSGPGREKYRVALHEGNKYKLGPVYVMGTE